MLRYARKSEATRAWTRQMLERKRPKVVAVALANKTARIAWALLTREQIYMSPTTATPEISRRNAAASFSTTDRVEC